MSRKMSIWTIEGRLERTGQKVTAEKLGRLKKKRDGQLTRLVKKHEKDFPKKVHRWQDKLYH